MALLHRMADLEDAGDLSPEELVWVEATEGDITQSDEDMVAEILCGAAVLETRPGEDAAVMAELWRQAGQMRTRDRGGVGRCYRAPPTAASAAELVEEEMVRRVGARGRAADAG
jgi:hypothetical protein